MNPTQKQALRAQAHHLKPVILLGAKGWTPAVQEETDSALTTHELIKIKLTGVEKDDRQALALTISTAVQAEMIQLIGHTLVLYRQNTQ